MLKFSYQILLLNSVISGNKGNRVIKENRIIKTIIPLYPYFLYHIHKIYFYNLLIKN